MLNDRREQGGQVGVPLGNGGGKKRGQVQRVQQFWLVGEHGRDDASVAAVEGGVEREIVSALRIMEGALRQQGVGDGEKKEDALKQILMSADEKGLRVLRFGVGDRNEEFDAFDVPIAGSEKKSL